MNIFGAARWEGCACSAVTESYPWRSVWGICYKRILRKNVSFHPTGHLSGFYSSLPRMAANPGTMSLGVKYKPSFFILQAFFSGARFPQGFSKTRKAVHSHLFHLTCSLVLQILLSSDKRQENVCFPCQNWFCLTGIVVGSSCIEGSMPTFICVQGTGSPGAKWNRVCSLSRGKMDWMATLLMSLFSLRVQTLPVLGS